MPNDLSLPKWRERAQNLLFTCPASPSQDPPHPTQPPVRSAPAANSIVPRPWPAIAPTGAQLTKRAARPSPTPFDMAVAFSANRWPHSLPADPRVTDSRFHYLVHAADTIHHAHDDRVCDCGGNPQRLLLHLCPSRTTWPRAVNAPWAAVSAIGRRSRQQMPGYARFVAPQWSQRPHGASGDVWTLCVA